MIGGYLSFQGIEAKAAYRSTALADVLPVELEDGDDRQETPEGRAITTTEIAHPITDGLDRVWPPVLGFQRLKPKPEAQVLATIDHHAVLVVGTFGDRKSTCVCNRHRSSLGSEAVHGVGWIPPTVGCGDEVARGRRTDRSSVTATVDPCARPMIDAQSCGR